MPQGPIAVAGANLIQQGAKSKLNITAQTLVKAAPGTVLSVQVVVAGSAPGNINDSATLAGVALTNAALILPNSVGPVPIDPMAFLAGIVVTPGTGQQVAITYI